MGYSEFNHKREQIVSALNRIADSQCCENVKALVEKCIDEIRNGRFTISIFGKFSNGKSMLLNALMGFDKEILEVDSLPSTAAVTAIQMPDSPAMENKARVSFNNGEPDVIVPLEEIGKYTAKHRKADGTSADDEVEDNVKEVRLYIKSKFLENGVVITDTPGFNSTYEKHTEISRSIIKESDATIFLFDYEQAGSATDFKIISLLQQNIDKAFLLMNKIDIAYEKIDADSAIDSVCDSLYEKLESQDVKLGNRIIYPVSAKYAFEANCMEESLKKSERMEKSRFEYFTSALEKYLCSDSFEKEKLCSPLRRLKKALKEIIDNDENMMQLFKNNSENVEQKIAALEAQIANEHKKEKEVSASVRRNVGSVFTAKRAEIKSGYDEIADDIISKINKVNTQYAINYRLQHGENWNRETYDMLCDYWRKTCNRLCSETIRVIEDVLEANDYNSDSLPDVLNEAVNVRLAPDVILCTDEEFKVDFSALERKQLELDRTKKKLDDTLKKIEELRKQSGDYDRAVRDSQLLSNEISRLNSNIEELLDQKIQIRGYRVTKKVYESRARGGFFGGIVDALFGEKVECHEETKTDNTEANERKKEYQELINKNEQRCKEASMKKREQDEIIRNNYGAELELNNAVHQQGELRKANMLMQEELDRERDDIENCQVQEYQDKLRKDIEGIVETFVGESDKTLIRIEKSIISIMKHLISCNNTALLALEEEKTSILQMKTKTESERRDELLKIQTELNEAVNVRESINGIEKI